MIYLTKGQQLTDNPSLVVYDPTGYYNDGDSIVCAGVGTPEDPACRYEAKYIKYGGMVYSISDPDALMAQILLIDPKTLFGKDSQQVAVDKAVSEIVPQTSTDNSSKDTSTTTPAQQPTTQQVDPTSTSTPPIQDQNNTSTTTDPIIDMPQATSTPDVLPDLQTSSTTPPISDATTTDSTNGQ